MTEKDKKARRLSREDWLREALLDLASDGKPKTVDFLVNKLGVTKGSFYHHFTDRADFVLSLVTYWDTEFTRSIADAIFDSGKSPQDELWALMLKIDEGGLGSVDLPIHNWALHNAEVAAVVARVDRFRLHALRQIFAAMGFAGEELEARTRSFVTLFSMEKAISDQLPKSRRRKHLKALHEFYTRP